MKNSKSSENYKKNWEKKINSKKKKIVKKNCEKKIIGPPGR